MATPVTLNGVSYSIPANREPRGSWGVSLSAYLVAISTATLQKSGGNFTLTADVNFGANYGLIAKYLKSGSASIATSGVVRFANTDTLVWRNAANSGDLPLAVNASDALTFDGKVLANEDDAAALQAQIDTHTSNIAANAADITTKEPAITAGTTGQYWRGDKSWQALDKSAVGLGNVDNISDANKPISTATATALAGKEPTITTLPISKGGTGQATKTAAFDALSPNTTKGDLTVRDSSNNVRVPVGADGTILTADSASTGGVKWSSASFTNPMTTAGDIIKGGAAGAAQRLGIGTTGQTLAVVSGAPAWRTGIAGTTTNDNATAGDVGEYLSASPGAAVGASSSLYRTVTSLTLTAGDWDVDGVVVFAGAVTGISLLETGISLTNNGMDKETGETITQTGGGANIFQRTPTRRITVANGSTTTVYLIGFVTYSSGSPTYATSSFLRARRMR